MNTFSSNCQHLHVTANMCQGASIGISFLSGACFAKDFIRRRAAEIRATGAKKLRIMLSRGGLSLPRLKKKPTTRQANSAPPSALRRRRRSCAGPKACWSRLSGAHRGNLCQFGACSCDDGCVRIVPVAAAQACHMHRRQQRRSSTSGRRGDLVNLTAAG